MSHRCWAWRCALYSSWWTGANSRPGKHPVATGALRGRRSSVGWPSARQALWWCLAGHRCLTPQWCRVPPPPPEKDLGQRVAHSGNRAAPAHPQRQRVLLIEDSTHFQTLVKLLMAHSFPEVDLHVADDGIVGLAMAGELQPDVLIVDILLPGIDGATLIARLRSHPQFQRSRLIVVTSLEPEQRAPYAFALAGLPVVHKPRLVQELPGLLSECLRLVA